MWENLQHVYKMRKDASVEQMLCKAWVSYENVCDKLFRRGKSSSNTRNKCLPGKGEDRPQQKTK